MINVGSNVALALNDGTFCETACAILSISAYAALGQALKLARRYVCMYAVR